MLTAVKIAVSLLAGSLLVWLAPLLVGGERELAIAGHIGTLVGAFPMLGLCLWGTLYESPAWIARQLKANWRWIRLLAGAAFVGLAIYVFVLFDADVPSLSVFYLACLGYLFFSLGFSAGLTLLGFLLAEYFLKNFATKRL